MLSPARPSSPVTRCEAGPAALNSAVNLSQHYFFVVHLDLSASASATHHETGGRARLPAAAGHAGKLGLTANPAQGWAVVAQQRGRRPSEGAGPVEPGELSWKRRVSGPANRGESCLFSSAFPSLLPELGGKRRS